MFLASHVCYVVDLCWCSTSSDFLNSITLTFELYASLLVNVMQMLLCKILLDLSWNISTWWNLYKFKWENKRYPWSFFVCYFIDSPPSKFHSQLRFPSLQYCSIRITSGPLNFYSFYTWKYLLCCIMKLKSTVKYGSNKCKPFMMIDSTLHIAWSCITNELEVWFWNKSFILILDRSLICLLYPCVTLPFLPLNPWVSLRAQN